MILFKNMTGLYINLYYHPILSVFFFFFSNELSSVLSSILSTHTYRHTKLIKTENCFGLIKRFLVSIWIPRKRILWELFCFKTCSHLNTQRMIFIFKSHKSLKHNLKFIRSSLLASDLFTDCGKRSGLNLVCFVSHFSPRREFPHMLCTDFRRENQQNCVKLI